MSKEKRNAELCRRYLAGDSVGNLAREFGLSTSTIWPILRAGGVTRRPDREPAKRRSQSNRPLSPIHAKIAHEVSYHRVIELDLSAQSFADRVGMSVKRLTGIESGQCDLTILELERLSAAIGKPLEDLIRRPDLRNAA